MSKLYFKIGADYDKVIRLRNEIAKLKQELLSMNQAANPQEFVRLERQLRQTSQEFENLVRQAALAATHMQNTTVNINHTTSSLGGMNSMLAKIGGTVALSKLASDIIRVRGEFQAADTAIQTLLGNKEKADALMKQVREYAKISPLEFSDVTAATQMMLGFNIEADKVPGFIKAIGDVSMGESQKFNSLTLAFSQMSATGRLLGGDLNQMINAGFNPLQVIAEKTGKSIATLKEEMSKGAITTEMVQQAFVDATSAGGKFYQMSENASKTINGQLSMLQDALDAAFNEMGEKSEGIIMSGIQVSTSLIQNYETIGKIIVGMIATYGVYKTALITNIALTRGWAVAARADAVAKGLQTIATKAQTVAQLALNSAMKANPYVLAATLVVGVATAMWAFHDSTTAAEKAQKRFNAQKEATIKKEQDHKQKLEELISTIQNECTSSLDRVKAMDAIKANYPSLFQKYIDEKGHIRDLIGLWKEYNEEASKGRVKENKNNYANSKTLISEYQKVIDLWKKFGEDPNFHKSSLTDDEKALANKYKNETLSTLKSKLEEENKILLEYQKEVRADELAQWQLDLKKKTAIQIKSELDEMKRIQQARKNNPRYSLNVGIGSLKGATTESEMKQRIAILESEYKIKSEGNSSYKEAFELAKKEWIAAKKALEESKKKSKDDYDKAKKELAAKEKAYKDLGGITDKGLKKQDSEAEKHRKKQQKLAKELLSIRRQNQQDEIYLMKEGSDKKLKQIELDYQKEIDAIKKQEKAWSSEQGGKLTQEQSVEISTRYTNADSKRDKSIADVYSEQMEKYKDLLSKYQDYTDQRLEIEKKFNDDIAVLQEARKKAEKQDNVDEVARVDRSIAKAIAEKGKELMRHDFDVLKQSPEYIRAFEDLRNTSSETLNSLLSQLENAKQTAAQTLNPKDLREYTTTIQEIMDELDTRNPFKALVDRQTELAEAERELADAKKQLDAVNGGSKIVTGVKSTSLGKDGKIRVENTYFTAGKALEKYNAAKDKAQKANNTFIKAEESAKERVDELGNAIKGIGDSIGGTSGEIISLIGDVALFTTGTIDGITKVAQTGANAMSAVEKASVILGIISAGIQLLQQLNSILPTADNQYEKFAEKVAEINKLTDAVNEYRIAALEAQQAENNWFSDDNLKNLRDYKKLHDEVAEAYKNKAKESQAIYQNKSGGGWFTNSWNWILDNTYGKLYGVDFARKYEEGQIAAINNLRIETRSRKKGFLGSGIGGRSQKTEDLVSWARNNGLGELFDNEGLINKEAANAILNQYGDKLVGQTKETLESLIELREKYDEYIEQLHEYVSSLYEPLVDNFINSIWDWFDSGKDALDSFRDYASETFRDIVSDMMRTIVLDKVVGNFSDDIASLYEEYAKGSIDEAELMKKVAERTSGLVDNYEQNIPTLKNILEQVDGYLISAGIDLSQSASSSQSSTKGYSTAASQDSMDEANGRMTALQIAGEEIKNQNALQTQSLNILTVKADAILSVNTDTRNIADEIRTIQVNSYLELQEIRENTGAIVKPIQQIQKDIAEVKKNTKGLS